MFISDVRNCQNKEQERVRVDKELANIRTRFKNERVSVMRDCFGLCCYVEMLRLSRRAGTG